MLIAPSKDHSIRYTTPDAGSTGGVLPASSSSIPPKPPTSSPRWTPVLSPTSTASAALLGNAPPRFSRLLVGSRIEVSGAGVKSARSVANLIGSDRGEESASGCALIVDYGAEHAVGNSLRVRCSLYSCGLWTANAVLRIIGVQRPQACGRIPSSWGCDIIANVDFALLKESLGLMLIRVFISCQSFLTDGMAATPLGTLRQGEFLNRMGIQLRTASLIRAATTPERRKVIEEGVNRLMDPLEMGGQYAVLGITSNKKIGPRDQGVWPFVAVQAGASSTQA